MRSLRTTWNVAHLPDPDDPQLKRFAGGDVVRGVWDGFARLARYLALLPDASQTISMEYRLPAATDNSQYWERLNIALSVESCDPQLHESTIALIDSSTIGKLYGLEPLEHETVAEPDGKPVVAVERRSQCLAPTIARDLNAKLPEYFYSISNFVSNPSNDYQEFIAILTGVRQESTISIRLTPSDVGPERHEHTCYLGLLQSINRHWDYDQKVDFVWDARNPNEPGADQGQILEPLRLRDPLADEIAKSQQRFHDSLRHPHLRFEILVSSESQAAATLIASALAESAFDEGQYVILSRNVEDDTAAESTRQQETARVLAGLRTEAPVDELLGLFRLPVVESTSPCCIRRNTDPVLFPEPINLIIGRDLGLTAGHCNDVTAGLPLQLLAKHLAVFGLPGSGKTTALMNLMVQLSEAVSGDFEETGA